MRRLQATATALAIILLTGNAPATGDDLLRRTTLMYVLDDSPRAERRSVGVFDPHPELGLDFAWAPENPGEPADGEGLATGKGKLTWRIGGSADYDRAAVHSTYEGEMARGRPNGQGRLTVRDGSMMEGNWADGRLEGDGESVDAAGNRYQGAFHEGLPEGQGRLYLANGNIYQGAFKVGKRDGEGTMRLAGGGTYVGRWADDRFAGIIPADLPDALAGGLTVTASQGGDAGRVEFGIGVDRRVTMQEESVRYAQEDAETGTLIRPDSPTLWDRWNGRYTVHIEPYWADYDNVVNYYESHVWLSGEIVSTDGKPFTLKEIEVDVKSSAVFRKPLFAIDGEFGCTSYRPTFKLFNSGEGKAYNASLVFAFTSRDGRTRSQTFRKPLGDIAGWAPVNVGDEIAALAGDAGYLKSTHFVCNGDKACETDPVSRMRIGDMARFAFPSGGLDISFGPGGNLTDRHIVTRIDGTLEYEWKGDGGSVFKAAEPLEAYVALGSIGNFEKLAECGAGFGGSPEAPEFLAVDLRDKGKDYSFTFPVRGKKSKTSHKVMLNLMAPRSSVHDVIVRARFADGTVRSSKPLYVKYFRIPEGEPAFEGPPWEEQQGCYMSDYSAC